ncbi:MAG TPA: ABC transporter ATP-binding protein [Anaerolineae bacterium]|nr:ABC transporter ATP-binding protein [Anaerolineae bacterium]HPL29242.1 ABC transporter ATP-binding protein [Anaerolineae bacterium]
MSAKGEWTLAVSGVSKRYGGVTAVDGVDISIQPGEIVALIGPNGAGKTTLFNIISGIVRPDRGELYLQGKRVTGLPSWKMAELGVGRTFQNIRLFADLTILENVALARKGTPFSRLRLEDVKDVLSRTGLVDLARQRTGALPYGLRRKVELARALAGQPKLILLDEPTAGMNNAEAGDLVSAVRDLAQGGISVLLIEHSMKVAMGAAHRVVVMSLGKKLVEGTADAIRKDPNVIQAYLGERRAGSINAR